MSFTSLRTPTIVTLIGLFVCGLWNESFAQLNKYNKGVCWLQFPTAIGCSLQIQSFDKKITKDDLDKIVSVLLNFGAEKRGLTIEFFPLGYPFFPDLARDSSRQKFIATSTQIVNSFDSIIIKLEKYQPPDFFLIVKEKLVENYKLRQNYNRMMLSYIQTNDVKTFKEEVLKYQTSNVIDSLFNKLENSNSYYERMSLIPSRIYNEINRKNFPLEAIQKLQEQLLKKNKIKIVYEECED